MAGPQVPQGTDVAATAALREVFAEAIWRAGFASQARVRWGDVGGVERADILEIADAVLAVLPVPDVPQAGDTSGLRRLLRDAIGSCRTHGESLDAVLAVVGPMLAAKDAEIERLRQGIWDMCIRLGMDHDGDLTPKQLTYPDITTVGLEEADRARDDYDEALDGITSAEADRDRLQGLVDAGRALHASDGVVEAPVCYQCSDPFPCPTIRALDPEAGGR